MPKRLIIYLHATQPVLGTWVLADETGKIIETVSMSDLTTLPTLEKNDETIIIVSGQDVFLTAAALPKLSQQRLQQALPFALEEQVTQDVSELHFAHADYDANGSLPVAVVAHEKMTLWLSALTALNITPHYLIPSTLILPFVENQWQINTDNAICTVRTGKYAGFVCEENNLQTLLELQLVEDAHSHSAKIIHTTFSIAALLEKLAAEFNMLPTINLLQGAYQTKKNASKTLPIWFAASCFILLWIILIFTENTVSYFILNKENESIETKINAIYQHHFPQAKSMVAPKERMSEKLRTLSGQSSKNNVLALLGDVGKSFKETKNIHIERLDFREQQLTLEITANTFDDIDLFTKQLTQQGLATKQQNAASSGTQVKATLLIRAGGV